MPGRLRLPAVIRQRTRLRNAVAAVVVAVLAAGAWGVYAYQNRYDESTDGPHGALPTAYGDASPAQPATAELRTHASHGVLGGLTVDPAAGRNGVTTRSLRTGDTYWTYTRDGVRVGDVALGEGTIALWFEDGVVVGLDPDSGEPRWHAEADYPGALSRELSELTVAQRTVLAADGDGITAFDADDGDRRWRYTPPKACRPDSGQLHALRGTANAAVFTLRETCPAAKDQPVQLAALDQQTGKERWRLPMGESPVLQINSHQLFTLNWAGRGRAARVDYTEGDRPSVKEFTVPDEHVLRDVTSELLTTDRSVIPARIHLLHDITDPRSAWLKAPAKGTRFGVPLLAGPRVYVVEQPETAAPGPNRLLVFDTTSGELRHELALPDVPAGGEEGTLDVVRADDGAVVVRRGGDGIAPVTANRLVIAH